MADIKRKKNFIKNVSQSISNDQEHDNNDDS